MVIVSMFAHPEKAVVAKFEGNVRVLIPLQFIKGTTPNVSTVSGIVNLVKPVQPLNAHFFISLTEEGILIFVNVLQASNALSHIETIVSGSSISVIPLQL